MVDKNLHLIETIDIQAESGAGFAVKSGQMIRVSCLDAGQVVDLFCVSHENPEEILSSGHTLDYNEKLFLTTGDNLFSNKSAPMLKFFTDPAGPHIMLYAPCSQEMYTKSYDIVEPHPNCINNLSSALAPFGVAPNSIGIPLNIFMHIQINPEGKIQIKPPRARAGDFLDLRAEMDLFIGVSACPAWVCNDFTLSPIKIEIFSADGSS